MAVGLGEDKIFNLFGLKFQSLNMSEAIERLEEFILKKDKPKMIFTPTAELIVRASRDRNLKEIYNNADMLTIDSYVVYYSAKILRKPVSEPVSAVRLMLKFLPIAHKKKYKMYLLGAKEEVVRKVVENLNKQYPGMNIAGWHDGYFDINNDEYIVQDIINTKPDILFVAMSSPLKEEFISKNLNRMNVPVSIGVGGTFDILAGKCKLAPNWISRIGLEWLYRLIQEPRRLWKRYLITNTKFLFLFLKELIKKKEENCGRV